MKIEEKLNIILQLVNEIKSELVNQISDSITEDDVEELLKEDNINEFDEDVDLDFANEIGEIYAKHRQNK